MPRTLKQEMSPNVVPFPGMRPQLWPIEDRQHCMHKYKHARELTSAQRQEHVNASAKDSSAPFLLRGRYGRAHTLLPDVAAHSCAPRAFAVSSPDSHQSQSTASSSPSPTPQNRTYPSFDPVSAFQIVFRRTYHPAFAPIG